jgi:hypothetical protein
MTEFYSYCIEFFSICQFAKLTNVYFILMKVDVRILLKKFSEHEKQSLCKINKEKAICKSIGEEPLLQIAQFQNIKYVEYD